MVRLRIFFVVFFTVCGAIAQEPNFVIPDSLKNKTFNELWAGYISQQHDTVASKIYLNTYYQKGVIEKNVIGKAEALSFLSFYSEDDKKIEMLDEAIELTIDSEHQYYPVIPYSFKGGHYLDIGNYALALKNYFKALEYAERNGNEVYEYITKHNIAIIKGDIGKFDESLKLFKECFEYEKRRETFNLHDYCQSLLYLSEAYLRIKEYDSAHVHIKEGLSSTKDTLPYLNLQFVLNEGVYHQKKGELDVARRNLTKVDDLLDKNNPESVRTLTQLYSYLGKNYFLSEKQLLGKEYLLKLDSIFLKENLIIPEVREGYELLVKHYETQDDYRNQLKYVNTLLRFDSIYYASGTVINNQLYKEFDTPQLLKEKEKLVLQLTEKTHKLNYYLYGAYVLSAIIFIVLIFQYARQKTYRKRFETLLNSIENKNLSTNDDFQKETVGKKDDINLLPDIVQAITSKLEQFESKMGYVQKDLTKFKLAKQLNTNSKYLSKVINHIKQKTFTQYINELRIDNAVNLLKEDSKLRQYTMQHIAEEAGFNNAESFSTAFKKRTGIKPSYFIKQLNSSG